MTQKDLISKLHKLRAVEPDAGFANRSRALIFATESATKIRWPIVLFWSGAFAAILILALSLASGGLGGSKPTLSASLNPDNLSREFNNLSINIELQNISYRQNVNQTIASALNEIGSNQAKHLNPDILQSEEQNLNFNAGPDSQIDELLKNIIF